MNILSIETATYFGGVAFAASGIQDAAGPFAPRTASREILTAIRNLLDKHACPPEKLDLIAVSTGPGLFTGVRVGMAIAKTLAWSLAGRETSLVAVPTLEAVASLVGTGPEGPQSGDLVVAITDARRGEVYAALFRVEQPSVPNGSPPILHALGQDLVVRPDRLRARLFPGTEDVTEKVPTRLWLSGDGAQRYRQTMEELFGEAARIVPLADGVLSLQVARLGQRRLEAGLVQNPESLLPHYVRRPDARLPVLQPYLSESGEAAE